MAKIIRNRTAAQCRSHHQKIQNRDYVKNMGERGGGGAWINRLTGTRAGKKPEMIKASEIEVKDRHRYESLDSEKRQQL